MPGPGKNKRKKKSVKTDPPINLPEIVFSSSSRLQQLREDYLKAIPFKPVKNKYSSKGKIDKKKTEEAKIRYLNRMNKTIADQLIENTPRYI